MALNSLDEFMFKRNTYMSKFLLEKLNSEFGPTQESMQNIRYINANIRSFLIIFAQYLTCKTKSRENCQLFNAIQSSKTSCDQYQTLKTIHYYEGTELTNTYVDESIW